MPGISSYILSIAGIVLISIIIDFAMPNKSMSKYIKSILGFFIIAVIISPIPRLISQKNITSFFDVGGYEIQEDYIYSLNKSKIDIAVSEIKSTLNAEGYRQIEIDVSFSQMATVKNVRVDLSRLIILDKAEHKNVNDIKVHISKLIVEKLGIEKEMIVYEN